MCVCMGGHSHLNTCAMFFPLFSPRMPNLGYSFETNSGNAFHYFTYGVACSEVEIDCLTGDHKVRNLQNFSTEEEKRETIELPYQELAETNFLLGKIMPHIIAWQISYKRPESKNFRLSTSILNSIIVARKQP